MGKEEISERYLHKKHSINFDALVSRACAGPNTKNSSNTKNNIWNGIGKGKYKVKFPFVGGYVGKEEIS